jgi:molecular chaperone GrpE
VTDGTRTDAGHAGPEQEHEAAAPGAAAPAGDLEAERDEARRQADEYLDRWRRAAADFDNYKKRVARDAEAARTRAVESLVGELLPVLDNLERALDASEHHEDAKVAEGVRLVREQLRDVLARRGLEPIDAAVGGRFDPHVHEALLHQPSEHEEGAIAAVYEAGYRLGTRVVRPARVVVSAGPADAEQTG